MGRRNKTSEAREKEAGMGREQPGEVKIAHWTGQKGKIKISEMV